MRVAVLGTGALGCLFAARLAAHAEVWMLGTWPEALSAVRSAGIRVHEGDQVRQASVAVASDPREVPLADLALVLVKSYQTERAAAWAAACLAPEGPAVTLQNGLDNGRRLAAAVGARRTVVGVTFEGATVLSPGEVRHAGRGATYLDGQAVGDGRGRAVVDLLRDAGFETHTVADIQATLWGKVLVNAAINPLTALWRVPNGELLASACRRALLAALAEETAAVASSLGISLQFADPAQRVEAVCRATAANRSSMLQDVERGRPTEIDSINGAIVCRARDASVPVPVNEAVWKLVKGAEACKS